MELKVINSLQHESRLDTLVIGLHQGADISHLAEYFNEEISSMTGHLLKEEAFTGKKGEVQSFRLVRNNGVKNIVLVGLGKENELCLEKIRRAAAKAQKECKKFKAKFIGLYVTELRISSDISVEEISRAAIEGMLLADYRFDNYKSDKKNSTLEGIYIICNDGNYTEEIENGMKEGRILANATAMARDLVNEPANTLTPVEMAARAVSAGEESGFEVEILNEDKIRELGMKAFWEVAKGADNPPRFIIMRYFGDKDNKEKMTGFVGKGLTYDSGGYALKPTEGMVNMKSDMAGGAAVIGAMSAIAGMKLNVNVVAVVAACENMVSGGAYRNGDIIGSMAGKTIEIKSTDAEGRLTLADAVYYAVEKEGVERVLDIATLTGAALVALGTTTTAVISNNDEFYSELEKAAAKTGEKVWRLPGFEEYKELIKSDIADLKNSGGRFAGTITGGLFVGEFVKGKPWIHMDIAGTSGSDKDADYVSRGGTGVGVRTLYELVKGM